MKQYEQEQPEPEPQPPWLKQPVIMDDQIHDQVDPGSVQAIEIVEDPELRGKLRPEHPFGCKRPLFSNDYFATFNRPNLELVTDAIERVTADSVVSVDGKARRIDTLIIATGFSATKYLSAIEINGRHGQRLD